VFLFLNDQQIFPEQLALQVDVREEIEGYKQYD
jgi:hypothetical protein